VNEVPKVSGCTASLAPRRRAQGELARDFAAEINYHHWSDAPYRIDRAGHRRDHDGGRRVLNSPASSFPDEAQVRLRRSTLNWFLPT
jgi:hypothetical protein